MSEFNESYENRIEVLEAMLISADNLIKFIQHQPLCSSGHTRDSKGHCVCGLRDYIAAYESLKGGGK